MSIKHIEEFEIYYNLGNSRSYREVAERIGKSPRTVETWGLKEKWSDEVKLRDLEVLKEQRKQTKSSSHCGHLSCTYSFVLR